ncbi:MAG: hypothetical protein WA632_00710 [Gallionella sp.]
MTQYTVLNRPSDLSIVASATEFPFNYFVHIDIVATGLEFEADISMTDLAAKAYSMEPMREYSRTYTGFIGVVVDYYVTVLRLRRGRIG